MILKQIAELFQIKTLSVWRLIRAILPHASWLDATIHLAGPDGVRSMSIADFYALDGMTRNVLKAGEFVTHVSIPEESDDLNGDYQKLDLTRILGLPRSWCCDGMET